MDNEPTNAAGPANLAPRPAPGLHFDARGVLVPIEPDPWVRLMKLAIEWDGETVHECAACGKHVRRPL